MNGLVFHQEENTSNSRDIDRRYYRNFRFQRHIHGNPELLYVIEGEIDVTVDECTETVSAGQMCMILPWQIHSFYTRDFSRTIVLVVAHSYLDDFLNSMRGYYGQTQVFRPEPAIQELFMQYLFTGPFPDPYIIASVLLGLCHCFTVQCPILPCENSRRAPALYDAFNYISAHYKEPLTLGSVAAELGYSYYYLSHIFKSYAGMGFNRFCNMRRVAEAEHLLRNTDRSVTDIALESGFSNTRSFNRAFLDVMHMPPLRYREQYSSVEGGERISIDEGEVQNIERDFHPEPISNRL